MPTLGELGVGDPRRMVRCILPRMSRKTFARAARSLAGRACLVAVATVVALFATGCAPVAPYERGKLAHPTMNAGSLDTMGEDHLHAISEGATGGSGGTGSGCGCN
jgi:hypothetical protein